MTNSMMVTEFKITGREFDGAQELLAKSFPLRMVNIVINEAVKKHGAENTLIPTDVHFIPVFLDGDSFFAVRAWHETQSPEGKVGVLQPFVGHFDVVIDEVHGYLRHRQEDGGSFCYKLTTAEALGLLSLSNLAARHDAIASSADQEAA